MKVLATDAGLINKERGMTLKKNQNKENSEPKAENKKKTSKAEEKENSTASTADTKPEEKPAEGAEQKTESEDQKKPSEIDFLKLYLSQTMEDLKKQKEENEKLKGQYEQINSQIEQCREKYDGLVAEYENYRRRTSVEKENISADVTAKAALALLPALDNLERAMPFAQSNHESFVKGVEMTLRQLSDAFRSLGVEEIEAQDAVFNPELHDAVMHIEDENVGESVITEVFQKGYKLGDKVVRHSVVKVAN